MNKNYLIIVLLFFCSILNAQNLNIVYIGNSITEGALLKNPKTEAAPIRKNSSFGTGATGRAIIIFHFAGNQRQCLHYGFRCPGITGRILHKHESHY